MKITFSSGINDIAPCNSSFDKGILQVAYVGHNRNNSFISKETFERCMPSIYNCPIVCRYDRETNTIGSHDSELVHDADGGVRIVNITQPVGVVPESARYFWREVEDVSGIHEYLCVDVLIWKRQEAYKKIKEDGIVDESMEISIIDGELRDGIYVINDFEFTAFCLLESAEPCYESASLEMFSCNDFKQQFEDMMSDFRTSFNLMQSSNGVVNNFKNNSTEGGEKVLNEKMDLLAEFGLNIDELDFALDDFTVDELREKFEAMQAEPTQEPTTEPEPTADFALEGQVCEELNRALSEEKVETSFGEITRYWMVDYDRDAMEVYCIDETDWNLYGFPFAMNGDAVVIDFACKKRMKYAVVPFDEGEQAMPFAEVYAAAVEQYNANDSQWSEKYEALSTKCSDMEAEFEALKQFKADVEDAQKSAEFEAIIEQFADLAEVEEFMNLCAADEAGEKPYKKYSAEDFREKCFAIRGRVNVPAKFSLAEQKAPKLSVERTATHEKVPYGGIVEKYNH